MADTTLNPTKEMKAYALEEMVRLIKNISVRPIDVYCQKEKGKEPKYFMGSLYKRDLIEALKKQYQ